MEFIGLPPEVTSALIHAGPGAESLSEAGYAWQVLGADLDESASAYMPVLSALVGDWNGPAAAAMTDAVANYLTWVRSTAQQALQLGSSAHAAAAAFNAVLAAVVPPSTVAANRARLAQLLATNGFGRNVAAIAETEQHYQDMWANNVSAMYRYEAASAQSLELPLFVSPPSITDSSGTAAQAQAVQTATANSSVSSTLNQLSSALTGASATALPADTVSAPVSPIDEILQSFGVTFDPNQGWFGLGNTYANQFISSGFPINMLSYLAQNTSAQALQSVAPDIFEGLSEGESEIGAAASSLANAGLGLAEPTALMGGAVSLGNLSAPPAATAVLTAAHPAAIASAPTPLAAAGDAGGDLSMLPPLMPPPITGAGSGWKKRKEQKYEDIAMGLEVKGTFVPRSPSAG